MRLRNVGPALALAFVFVGVASGVNVRIGLDDAGSDFRIICSFFFVSLTMVTMSLFRS